MPLKEKIKKADIMIDNNQSSHGVKMQVLSIVNSLQNP